MKLTLNIEPGLIDQIKSLDELPDWVKEFAISGDPVPDFDHKAEYHKHLEEKYGL